LKKTRRIEITAFRHQVTIDSGKQNRTDADSVTPSGVESRRNFAAIDRFTTDLGAVCGAGLGPERAGELVSPGRALIESENGSGTSIAARRNTLYAKLLRGLGLSLKKLKPNQSAPSGAEMDS